MRILQLGKFYPIRGGVEKVMWDLTESLSSAGVPCDMLCAKFPYDDPDEKDLPFYSQDGVFTLNDAGRVFCVPAWAKLAATMIAPRMISWLRRHGKEYDIIHLHHPDPMAALALRLSGYRGKVVLHWHSDIISQKFFLRLYKPLQDWIIRRSDKILGTTPVYINSSPYLREVQEKCDFVPIGIDPVSFNLETAGAIRNSYPGKTLLVSVGRLVPYKGFSFLIEAMTRLPERFHLLLAGKGPLKESLINQIRNSGLQDRVTILGYVSDDDLPALFGAADIFVLSSVMKTEAFGIVQIEAMSCGTPVVATRIPESGVTWVNEDGVSGLNAEPKDVDSLAKAIMGVESDIERYSAGALQRFNQLFTKEQMCLKVKSVYDSLYDNSPLAREEGD
ncbi:MAG: glycosyltransferase [Bacteroidales bacterium]|nr:glycosyltransferase [Bacteroidales bacterium]